MRMPEHSDEEENFLKLRVIRSLYICRGGIASVPGSLRALRAKQDESSALPGD